MDEDIECDRLTQRRSAILASARQLFVEQGYERTTLGQIVNLAGGSLATLYKLFGNKEGLLEAVVAEQIRPGTAIVRELASQGGSAVCILKRICIALHDRYLNEEGIALARLVIARSIEDAEFARSFFETKMSLTNCAMTELFEEWRDAGIPMNGEPAILADIFIGLIINDFQQEAIYHVAPDRASEADIQRRIDFFIRGAGIGHR